MWNIAAHIWSFVFFIKTKKMIFLEAKVTVIGEDMSTKCLQYSALNMIIHKESHSWEKVQFYTYFFLMLSTDLHINAIMMVIRLKSF